MCVSEKLEKCFMFAPPVVSGQCSKFRIGWPFKQQVSHFLAKGQGRGRRSSPLGMVVRLCRTFTLDAAKKCDMGVNAKQRGAINLVHDGILMG